MTGDYEFRGFYIPAYMVGGLERYIKHGIMPGNFLTAVLCNDLSTAVEKADTVNLQNLPAYVGYLYNEAPALCYGSLEIVNAWRASFQEESLEQEMKNE